ncbi:unnamed protein product [Musa acuminata var. zebrina]
MAGGDGERRPCGGTVPLELLIGEQARTEKRERPRVRVRLFRPVQERGRVRLFRPVQERGGLLHRQNRLPWRPRRPVVLLRFCGQTSGTTVTFVIVDGWASLLLQLETPSAF